jgi:hypothetical protein
LFQLQQKVSRKAEITLESLLQAGKHDDQVDAGLIGQVLDKMTAGKAPSKPPCNCAAATK